MSGAISRPEIVLDTNVLLDAWLFRDPPTGPLLEAMGAGAVLWVATEAMLDELRRVLARGLPPRWEAARLAMQTVEFRSRLQTVDAPLALAFGERLTCSDPDDQKFIDLAVARRCRWLVTRDRALLRLAKRASVFGVSVTGPGEWHLGGR